MASLRDVLNHIGKDAEVIRGGQVAFAALAIRRGPDAFIEPRGEPQQGDRLRFIESGESFRIESAQPEQVHGRLDHYRLKLAPA